MVLLGVVCKIRLKYSKKLLDYRAKNTKTYIINNKSYNESPFRPGRSSNTPRPASC